MNLRKAIALLPIVLLLLAGKAAFAQLPHEIHVGDSVLFKLKEYSHRKNLVAKGLRSVLRDVDTSAQEHPQASGTQAATNRGRFEEFRGYKAAFIDIEVLDPLGKSVDHPDRKEGRLDKLGNAVHTRTRNAYVRSKLLFDRGDELDPFALSESERILRLSPAVLDARVYVTVIDTARKLAKVFILVQDVFAISGSASGSVEPAASGSFNYLNMFGYNHNLQTRFNWVQDRTLPLQYRFGYSVPQASYSFATFDAFYERFTEGNQYGFTVGKPFIVSTINTGGAYTFISDDRTTGMFDGVNVYPLSRKRFYLHDIWGGYAFNVVAGGELDKTRQLFLSSRYRLEDWAQVPTYADSFPTTFANKNLLLGSIGYNRTDYNTDIYIFDFIRREDIPIGFLLQATGGYEFSTFENRVYAGIKAAGGFMKTERTGYLYGALETGTYLKGTTPEDGVISLSGLYFTPLLYEGNWRIRAFFWGRYTQGYNRLLPDRVSLNRELGLRRFSSAEVLGTQRTSLNTQVDFFSPYILFGFRNALFLSFDYGMIACPDGSCIQKQSLLKSRLYQGYGVGVRLRNPHLNISLLQFALYWYPGTASLGNKELSSSSTASQYFRFQNFNAFSPYQVPFR